MTSRLTIGVIIMVMGQNHETRSPDQVMPNQVTSHQENTEFFDPFIPPKVQGLIIFPMFLWSRGFSMIKCSALVI